jgi:two-component system NtrC family response regulator
MPLPPPAQNRVEAGKIASAVRVLIVEDQEVLRELLCTVFGRAGFEARAAGSVAEALRMLHPAPQFLTLDLHLPDGRGTEILQRIREERLPVQVALTTGTIDSELLAAAARLKPDRIFQKPYSAMDIVKWIRDCSSC